QIGPMLYGNSASDAEHMFSWVRARDVPVHVSVFEPGFLRSILDHRRAGTLPRRVKVQLYFGDRVPFGLPPTRASLDAYVAMLEGTGLPWMVGVMGGDVVARMAAWAVELGGHVRVGLEDCFDPVTNESLVEGAVALVRSLGCEVATCEQALELLA
ncbi:MAG TPA: 3-keto-5-aminohexanoate cleavage protein, partial [Acidimicrobiales bacterium]|nr:3-keto-5-aminohexanoate cleavage protein [Acidimicrobiales bacterium]